MRCQCERCVNNEDGYCCIADCVDLDENGVCVDMYEEVWKDDDKNAT